MSRSRLSSAAACLVAIALVSGAAAACGSKGSGPATPVSSGSPASQNPSPTATTTPPPTSTSPSLAPVASAPAGFRAASVTFVSLDQAFVLGTAPGHGAVLLGTRDRGQTWARLAAPVVGLGRPDATGSKVWGTRFATPSHGFIFGRGLWETVDGGAHWSHAAAPGGAILSLATIRGHVLALVQAGPSSSTVTLVRRDLSGGRWVTVHALPATGSTDPTDLISTQAGTAAILNGAGGVLVTRDGGASWTGYAVPGTSILAPAAVAATSPATLAVLDAGNGAAGSMQKLVYTSANTGKSWAKAGAPGLGGDPVAIAGGSPTTLLVAAASGASEIYRSSDGGHTWRTAIAYGDGGMGWADLGFTSATHAVVVHGPADASGNTDGRPGRLLLSSDGGATWQAVTF